MIDAMYDMPSTEEGEAEIVIEKEFASEKINRLSATRLKAS